MKIAFSGSSGGGKTTLVKYIHEKYGIPHISGSAGDLKQDGDKMMIDQEFGYPGGGHIGVIKYSALNPEYGIKNQEILQQRRMELIMNNENFITDRSPADNLTYFINQVAYHPMVTDDIVKDFAYKCLQAWQELDLVIYVKAVQPDAVERNGSRVGNSWYQKQVDCLFEYWIRNYFLKNSIGGPEFLMVDIWEWDERKQIVDNFIRFHYSSAVLPVSPSFIPKDWGGKPKKVE